MAEHDKESRVLHHLKYRMESSDHMVADRVDKVRIVNGTKNMFHRLLLLLRVLLEYRVRTVIVGRPID